MKISHGRVLPQVRGVNVRGGRMEVYKVSFPRILNLMECPVEGCPDKAKKPGRIRDFFMFRHWKSKVDISQEGPEPSPRSDQCRMHMQAAIIFKYWQSDKCHK